MTWRILRKLAGAAQPESPTPPQLDGAETTYVHPRIQNAANRAPVDFDNFVNSLAQDEQNTSHATLNWGIAPRVLLDPFIPSTPSTLFAVSNPAGGIPAAAAGFGTSAAVKRLTGGKDSFFSDIAGLGTGLYAWGKGSQLAGKYIPGYEGFVQGATHKLGHPGALIGASLLNPSVWDGSYSPNYYINFQRNNAARNGVYPDPKYANHIAFVSSLLNQSVDTAATALGGPTGMFFSKGGGVPTIVATASELSNIDNSPHKDEILGNVWKSFSRYGVLNYGMNFNQGEDNEQRASDAISRVYAYDPNRSLQDNANAVDILSVAPEYGIKDPVRVIDNTLFSAIPGIREQAAQLQAAGDVAGLQKLFAQSLQQVYGTDDMNDAFILHRVMYQSPIAQQDLKIKLSDGDRTRLQGLLDSLVDEHQNGRVTDQEFSAALGQVKAILDSGYRLASRQERAQAISARIQEVEKVTGLSRPIAALALESGIDLTDRAIQNEDYSSIAPLKAMDSMYRSHKRAGKQLPYRAYQHTHVRQLSADAQSRKERVAEYNRKQEAARRTALSAAKPEAAALERQNNQYVNGGAYREKMVDRGLDDDLAY